VVFSAPFCDTRPKSSNCFIRRNRGRTGWDVYNMVVSSFDLVVTLNNIIKTGCRGCETYWFTYNMSMGQGYVTFGFFTYLVYVFYLGIHFITLRPVSRSIFSPLSSMSSMLYSSFRLGVILFISQWLCGSVSLRYRSRSLSLMFGCFCSMFSISCWWLSSLYSCVVYASRLVG